MLPKLIESSHLLDPSTLPTWDQLSNFCIANRYYSSDVPSSRQSARLHMQGLQTRTVIPKGC